MAARSPHLVLSLAAEAASGSLVRQVLAGMAEAVDLPAPALDDVLTAVSEAINNVALHAYPEAQGTIELDVMVGPELIEVTVSDQGRGIALEDGLVATNVRGVGIAAIEAFTSSVRFDSTPGGGTKVQMQFVAVSGRPPTAPRGLGLAGPAPILRSDLRLMLSPATLAEPILVRLLLALAARARFTVDRLSDAEIVAVSLASAVGRSLGADALTATLVCDHQTVELELGPLGDVAGRQLLEPAYGHTIGPVIEQLADDVSVTQGNGGETVAVRIYDRRPPVAGAAGGS